MEVKEWLNNYQLGCDIFDKKYRHNNESFDEFIERITNGKEEYKNLILSKKFIPGGRILANRGIAGKNGIKSTYSNCYVLSVDDSIESIYSACADIARTYSYGGGCGIDISNLRPKGAVVHNSAKETTGAVSFMKTFDTVTGTIGQNGRRGALMISMSVNHPDIQEFVDIKANTTEITNANISVRVTDDFMRAVEKNSNYVLSWPIDEYKVGVDASYWEYNKLYFVDGVYYKKIMARELFNKLVENNWNYAEPGILYWDNIEKDNMMSENKDFNYAGVNPCAEEPLVDGGACLLGSMNIASFVKKGIFDYEEFDKSVRIAVNYLNDCLDEGIELHPLEKQRIMANKYKAIGLGIMDLAGALVKLEKTYGSADALEFCNELGIKLLNSAFCASCDLNTEGIVYDNLFDSEFYKTRILPYLSEQYIGKYPRNSQILTIAPTGTISTMINSLSGGAEPAFALSYTRTTKSLYGKDVKYEVHPKLVEDYIAQNNTTIENLPEYFISSDKIDYKDRISMQGVLQKYIDASISSTINLDEDATVKDVYDLYMTAWKKHLKGVTIFRRNCKRAAILDDSNKKEEKHVETKFDYIEPVTRTDLGKKLSGVSYKCKNACGGLYLQINNTDDNHIVELFANPTANGGCHANLAALARQVSNSLRSGITVESIINSLSKVQCQACIRAKAKGEKLDGNSCADIMAHCLKDRYEELNKKIEEKDDDSLEECPECHCKSVKREAGCKVCSSCGWSKCN